MVVRHIVEQVRESPFSGTPLGPGRFAAAGGKDQPAADASAYGRPDSFDAPPLRGARPPGFRSDPTSGESDQRPREPRPARRWATRRRGLDGPSAQWVTFLSWNVTHTVACQTSADLSCVGEQLL